MTDLGGRRFERILVIKLSSIGDVTMATPVARGLRDLYPNARIDWIVEPLSADVLAGNPFLNEAIPWHRKSRSGFRHLGSWAGEYVSLARQLRGRYDLALDLQGLVRSGLVALSSGAAVRAGKADSREGSVLCYTHRIPVRHDGQRAAAEYVQVLPYFGHPDPPLDLEVYPDDANRARADELLAPLAGRATVSITPATTRPYKHWTDEAWAETLDLLRVELGLTGIIHGSPNDHPMAERIASLCRKASPQVIAGATTLRDAAEVIGRSALTVGVDTGLMHFGIAMKTPTIAIFGPTTARRLSREPGVVVLQKAGPRRADTRVRRSDWVNDRSIDENTPQDVLAAAAGLLSAARGER